MYMDDIKLFGKKKKNWKLMWTIRIYSQDKGMECGLEKCVMLIMKSRKIQVTQEIELPYQERIRLHREKKNYRQIPSNKRRWKKKKKRKRKENLRRTRMFLKVKHCSRNLIKSIKKKLGYLPWKMHRTILKMNKGGTQTNGPEDKKVDNNTQGLTFERWHRQTIYKRKKNLPALKIAWMHQYGDYIKKSKERLITAASNSTDKIRTNRTITRKQKQEEKQLYGYFKQHTGKISHKKTRALLQKENLKWESESLLIAEKSQKDQLCSSENS